jgi:hypothetical protein
MKPAFGLLLLGLLLSTGGAAAQDLSQLSEQELEARAVALFQRSCTQAGCHTGPIPQQGMDLTADQFYASLVGVPSQERPELMLTLRILRTERRFQLCIQQQLDTAIEVPARKGYRPVERIE